MIAGGLCRRGGDPLRPRLGSCGRPLHGLDHQYRPLAMVPGAGRAGVLRDRAGRLVERGGPRAKARLSLMFGQAAYVFASVALSGLFVNVIKMSARPGPAAADRPGRRALFRPADLRLSQRQLSVRPCHHGRRDRRHIDGLVSALVAAVRRARPVLRRDADRRRRRIIRPTSSPAFSSACSSRSAWRAGWPGAACVFRFVPGKILPAAAGARQENPCRDDSTAAASNLPAIRGILSDSAKSPFHDRPAGVGPAKVIRLDQRPILATSMHFVDSGQKSRMFGLGRACGSVVETRPDWRSGM